MSQAEARARLEEYGRNELTTEKPGPAWKKFLAQFQDVLVVLLLIATWLRELSKVVTRLTVNNQL